MELWIRSQNRLGLVKITDVCIDYNNQKSIIANVRKLSNGDDDYFPLGEYDTEERALEVLDEIQRLITPEINYNPVIKREMKPEDTYVRTTFERYETTIESLPCYVYEMPKE